MTIEPSLFDPVIEHLHQELGSIRTGRANPALVENVKIEAYGSLMPLVQLASISNQDSRTIVIQPWDKNVLKDIERGLQSADLGMNPVNDGVVIRMIMPALTEERRREYIKLLGQKLEAGRVAVRKTREDEIKRLKSEKDEGLSEDEFSRQQRELQKIVDEYIAKIDDLGQKKETELMTV